MSKVGVKYAVSIDCIKEQILWPCFIRSYNINIWTYKCIYVQAYIFEHTYIWIHTQKKSQKRSFKMSAGTMYTTLSLLG